MYTVPSPSLRTPNSSQARPGSRISAGKPQQPFRFDLLDAPEVERLARAD
jgi:hypothetical protein